MTPYKFAYKILSRLSIECLRVKHFTLPVGDINSPSDNKFTEGIDFFAKLHKLLAEHVKVEKFQLSKSIIYIKNQFLMAENHIFNDIKVGETILVVYNIHYLHF